jgi:hypothetical protein
MLAYDLGPAGPTCAPSVALREADPIPILKSLRGVHAGHLGGPVRFHPERFVEAPCPGVALDDPQGCGVEALVPQLSEGMADERGADIFSDHVGAHEELVDLRRLGTGEGIVRWPTGGEPDDLALALGCQMMRSRPSSMSV